MTLSDIIYHDVQEAFGMGGPYIGKLELKGRFLKGAFLADGEKLSENKTKAIFSKLIDAEKAVHFGMGHKRKFGILVYDSINDEFYESIEQFKCLSIEQMDHETIVFHEAFHTSRDEYRRSVEFNTGSFKKVEKESLFTSLP